MGGIAIDGEFEYECIPLAKSCPISYERYVNL